LLVKTYWIFKRNPNWTLQKSIWWDHCTVASWC